MDAGAVDEDAGPTEPAAVSDTIAAPGCKLAEMEPETAASLGWQLLLCGDKVLSRLELATGAVSVLIQLSNAAQLHTSVTRDHVIVSETDGLGIWSLSGAPVVSRSHYGHVAVSGDQRRLLIEQRVSGELESIALDGSDPVALGRALRSVRLDASGQWVLCDDGQRRYRVGVSGGARRDLGASSTPAIMDSPLRQLAWLDQADKTIHSERLDGSEAHQWPAGERAQGALLGFSGDGTAVIVGEANGQFAALGLRDGTWRALATPPAVRQRTRFVTPGGVLLELESPQPPDAGVSLPVTLAALPLDGAALVELGEIGGRRDDVGRWQDSFSFDGGGQPAVFLDGTGSWRRIDLTSLTTVELLRDAHVVGEYAIPLSPDGELALLPACPALPTSDSSCEAVLVDRGAHTLLRARLGANWDWVSFAPDSQRFLMGLTDHTLLLGARSGTSQRVKPARAPGWPHRWLDARRFAYELEDGVHLLGLPD